MHSVYSTKSFAIASVLGGPLAAAYMASSNYDNFGEANKSHYAWLTAILLMLAAVATGFVPVLESIPGFISTLLVLLVVQLLVHRFQGKKIREHIDEGGAVYPISRAILVGLISLVVVVTVIFGIAFLLDSIGGLQV